MHPLRTAAFGAVILAFCAPAYALHPDSENCLACHASKDSGAPLVDVAQFSASRHGQASCGGCHADVKDYPHPAKIAKATCVSCHRKEASQYNASVHGRAKAHGDRDAAICLSCHGGNGHAILKGSDPLSSVSQANLPKTCAKCHSDPELARRHGLSPNDMYAAYMNSTHAKADPSEHAAHCASCHGSHDIRPPNDPASSIAPGRIVRTCGRCHAVEAVKFAASIHGQAASKGVRAAPTCTDCHGEHDIQAPGEPGSRVARGARARACADCHQSQKVIGRGVPGDRVSTFLASFHGMAGKSGDQKVADCESCHGWHDVQPSTLTISSTHPDNLPQTCGQCHPGAGQRWVGGVKIHQGLSDDGASPMAGWIVLFYRIIIPLTVVGMILHNLLDLSRKMRGPRGLRHRSDETPLSFLERSQHVCNAVSFLLLAYSGFALHFPDSWWAWPLTVTGGETARRYAHRAAASLFLVTAAAHLAYLATTPGRRRLRAMLPALRDLRDPIRLFTYNWKASEKKPLLAQFSYIEKFEYWALVWGSCVMTVTGGFLLLHNLTMAYLPLWVIEISRVVHYLEAVLACLAILIWHGYWVILDPDVYPMNWAWLTGETYLPQSQEHHDEKGL